MRIAGCIFATLSLLVVGLAGCTAAPPMAGPPRFESTVWYEVLADAETIAHINYTLEDKGSVLQITAQGEPKRGAMLGPWELSGEPFTTVASLDASTGGLLSVKFQNFDWYPFGIERTQSAAGRALLDFGGNLEAVAVPFSSQFPLWSKETSPGERWGESTASWGAAANGSIGVKMQGQCQTLCSINNQGDDMVFTYTSWDDERRLFPQLAVLTATNATFELRYERVSGPMGWSPSGTHAPLAEPLMPTQPRCGPVPCDGESWPTGWSFQPAVERLHADPAWHAYQEAHPLNRPASAYVSSSGTVKVLGIGADIQKFWSLSFVDPDAKEEQVFQLAGIGRHEAAQPVTVTPFVPRTPLFTPPGSLHDLPTAEDSLTAAVAEAGTSLTDLHSLAFQVTGAPGHPDPRAQYLWMFIPWNEESGQASDGAYVVSALLGRVLYRQAGSPDLPQADCIQCSFPDLGVPVLSI